MFRVGLEAGKPDGPILAENATKYFVNKGINELKEKFTTSAGSGITLTNEPKFNGACSRSKLTKMKDGPYIINLDDYKSLYVNGDNVIYLTAPELNIFQKELNNL